MFPEVGDQQRQRVFGAPYVFGIGLQRTGRVLLWVGIAQEKEVFGVSQVFADGFRRAFHRAEPVVVAVVNGHDASGVEVQCGADAVALELRDGDDHPASGQDARHYQAAVDAPQRLVERFVARGLLLEEDDVVER